MQNQASPPLSKAGTVSADGVAASRSGYKISESEDLVGEPAITDIRAFIASSFEDSNAVCNLRTSFCSPCSRCKADCAIDRRGHAINKVLGHGQQM